MVIAPSSPLNIAILAAGQGKRMRSGLPKVLHPLGGRPLLAHVLDTARKLAADRICVVYGHGGEAVRSRFPEPDLHWALQDPPLGTGHALAQALPQLAADGVTLVLFGADPLASATTLESVIRHARGGALSLLTIELDDPTGYGRIVRDSDGAVTAIVEHKDATPGQRAIREINTGVMAAPTACFARWLKAVDNRNASGEYYLTDVIALARKEGVPIETSRAASVIETLGVNTMRELAQLERLYQRAQADALLDAGVTLADPDRIDIRGTLACGADVAIDVGCVFEGTVRLADGVAIGANCVLKDVTIEAGAQVLPFCHLEDATIGANCRIGPYARLRPGAVLAEDVHIGNFVEVKASIDRARLEGQPPGLRRRHDDGRRREFRRRIDHGELRRREQASHRDRGRREHRVELRAGRAGHDRPRRDDRRRQHDRQGGAGRNADRRPRAPGEPAGLEAAGQATETSERLTPCAALSARSPRATSFRS